MWAEELAAPYRIFEQAGISFDIASPKGGSPPIDPMSLQGIDDMPLVSGFLNDPVVQRRLTMVVPLDQVDGANYDAIFVVGGYGVMWDLFRNPLLHTLIATTVEQGHVVAAVCHGAGVLAKVRHANGAALVRGHQVTGFSNDEEVAVALGVELPAFVETALREAGAQYAQAPQIFTTFTVRSGQILTGQNPQSSEQLAHELVAALQTQYAA